MSSFICRIIGKAERVSTIAAHIFGKPAAAGYVVDAMTREEADGGVANPAGPARRCGFDVPEEAVATEAGVLFKSLARGHMAHAVTGQSAQVPDLFPERIRCRVGIVLCVEQQGMSALNTDVFVAAVTIGELFVMMLSEKARQRVTYVGD
jgi:hypothetical protein